MSEQTEAYVVNARLETHEAVCAERYSTINSRLSRMEAILLSGTGAIILALVAIAWKVASP
jgi:hypothetical protein